MSESREETKYLLTHALRSSGYNPVIAGDAFHVEMRDYQFSLTLMPGNRRVLISHRVFIAPECRGRGLGKQLLLLREVVAKEAGCNLILATVRDTNSTEVHLLETRGWKRYNQRDTGVSLWGKEL